MVKSDSEGVTSGGRVVSCESPRGARFCSIRVRVWSLSREDLHDKNVSQAS